MVAPVPEVSCTSPGTSPRCSALTGTTKRPFLCVIMASCKYFARSPEIRRPSVSRTLPPIRRISRRIEASSAEAPSAISSSDKIDVVMDSSSARFPDKR